jgi:hypothetical protein
MKNLLQKLDACKSALAWVGDRARAQAWAECEYSDWMLWLLAHMEGQPGWPDHKTVVLCACDCVETSLQYATDPRPAEAIEITRAWCRGAATLDQVWDAGDASWAAAVAAWSAAGAAWAASMAAEAASMAASLAAWSAAGAAEAVGVATLSARSAAWAARSAAGATRDTTGPDEDVTYLEARYSAHKAMCDLIRSRVPTIPEEKS